MPLVETMPLLPTTNPYGESKAIYEKILIDSAAVNPGWSVALLRYFSPSGEYESNLIGESTSGIPSNLMPYITQVAKGKLTRLRGFGSDYRTED